MESFTLKDNGDGRIEKLAQKAMLISMLESSISSEILERRKFTQHPLDITLKKRTLTHMQTIQIIQVNPLPQSSKKLKYLKSFNLLSSDLPYLPLPQPLHHSKPHLNSAFPSSQSPPHFPRPGHYSHFPSPCILFTSACLFLT